MRVRSTALPTGRAANFCVVACVGAAFLFAASPAGAQAAPPPGAASCSGCHVRAGTLSVMVPLFGRQPDEIVAAMRAFRSGERPATVMDRLAKGFTEEETRAIATFVSSQP
jgi:cytochrome subunit of sulfide dehydrogenase